jgi:hypothetical protein
LFGKGALGWVGPLEARCRFYAWRENMTFIEEVKQDWKVNKASRIRRITPTR